MGGQLRQHAFEANDNRAEMHEEKVPENVVAPSEGELLGLSSPASLARLADVNGQTFELLLAPGKFVEMENVGDVAAQNGCVEVAGAEDSSANIEDLSHGVHLGATVSSYVAEQ